MYWLVNLELLVGLLIYKNPQNMQTLAYQIIMKFKIVTNILFNKHKSVHVT